MLNKLNEVLKEDYSSEPYKQEDLIFIESLLKIVLSNKLISDISTYNSFMSFDENLKHSLLFMNNINPRYSELTRDIIFSGNCHIKDNQDELSIVYNCNGQKNMDLFLRNTIEDSYTITHEAFHYINLEPFKSTNNWSLMTEAISLTAEGLQKEYFRKVNLLDYKNNDRNTFYAIGIKAYRLDFEIKLLKYFLKNHYIDKKFINSFLDNKNNRYVEAVMDDIEEIIDGNELLFFSHQRYIIAAILSSLLINKILNNPDNIKLFIELNDNCNTFSFTESLEYLGLKVVDKDNIILSDDSLNLLDKEYQKRLSKL